MSSKSLESVYIYITHNSKFSDCSDLGKCSPVLRILKCQVLRHWSLRWNPLWWLSIFGCAGCILLGHGFHAACCQGGQVRTDESLVWKLLREVVCISLHLFVLYFILIYYFFLKQTQMDLMEKPICSPHPAQL